MNVAYQQYTIKNRSLIKRFSHRGRFKKVVTLCRKFDPSSLLDVGTGDGHFISLLHGEWGKPILLHAIEPDPDFFLQAEKNMEGIPDAQLYKDWQHINRKYALITCQEVFEHLFDHQLDSIFSDMKKHLEEDGYIIATVPIETGLAGLLKNTVRACIGGTHHGASFKNIIRATFNLPIRRIINESGYMSSHIGFRINDLEKAFKRGNLSIIRTGYSPFPFGGSWLNSQKIYIMKPGQTVSE